MYRLFFVDTPVNRYLYWRNNQHYMQCGILFERWKVRSVRPGNIFICGGNVLYDLYRIAIKCRMDGFCNIKRMPMEMQGQLL